MKRACVTAILLAFCSCCFTQNAILERKVRLKKHKGTIAFLLSEIEAKGAFVFSYGHDIPVSEYRSLSSGNQTIKQYLFEMFGGSVYTIEYGNKLLLVIKPEMPYYYQIKGKVIDTETKQPIEGVTICIPNSQPLIGGVTDKDGFFRMNTKTDVDAINLSCIGYQSDSVSWFHGNEPIIELDPYKHEISEIEIVYYLKPKSEHSNYAGSIVNKDVIDNAKIASIENILQGTSPGVHVVANSGMPGASLQVKIRGVNSAINSDPVYMLDGIPVQQSFLYTISPSDIKSITIIKDAAELAKYGAIAGNGVVLLQSKVKKSTALKVSYNFSYGLQQVYKKLSLMTTDEFVEFSTKVGRNSQVPDSLDAHYNADWQNTIFHKGIKSEHVIALGGGNDRNHFQLSTSLFNQEAIVKNLSLKRYTFKVSSGHKVNARLYFNQNTALSYVNYKGINEGTFLNDYGNVLLGSILRLPFPDTNKVSPIPFKPSTYIINPSNDFELVNNSKKNYSILNNFSFKAKVFPKLTYISNFGVQTLFQNSYNTNRTVMLVSPDSPKQFYVSEYNVLDLSFTWQQNLEYTAKLFNKHLISTGINTELIFCTNSWIPIDRTKHLGSVGGDADSIISANNVYLKEGSVSNYESSAYAGFVNYNFKKKYFASFHFRTDKIVFKQNNGERKLRHNYPSVGLGWLLSNEEFWNSNVLEYFKFRVSYGKAGISPVVNYSFYNKIFRDFEYLYAFESSGTTSISAKKRRINEKFYYENIDAHNVGIDLGFLRNSIFFSIDYFRSHTHKGNMYTFENARNFYRYLTDIEKAGTISLESAGIINSGFEYELSYKQKVGKLSYNLNVNFTQINNRIVNYQERNDVLYNENSDQLAVNLEGGSIGSFYGYKTNGIFTQNDIIEGAKVSNVQPNAREGDLRFVDINNDGKINLSDKTIIGNPFPDFTFGVYLNFKYANLDLSAFMQGVYGNDIFNATRLWLYNPYGLSNWSTDMYNSYRKETKNDPGNRETSLFRVDYLNLNKNLRVSDFYIEDGSFLRFKNIQLGYTFNNNFKSKNFYENVRVFVSVQNIYTITNYTGYDPEVGGWGIDCGAYPNPKVYMFGANVNF